MVLEEGEELHACVCGWAFTVFHAHSLQMGEKEPSALSYNCLHEQERSVHHVSSPPFSFYTRAFAIKSQSAKVAAKTKAFPSSVMSKHEKVTLRVPARMQHACTSVVLTTASLPASVDLLRDLAEELQ